MKPICAVGLGFIGLTCLLAGEAPLRAAEEDVDWETRRQTLLREFGITNQARLRPRTSSEQAEWARFHGTIRTELKITNDDDPFSRILFELMYVHPILGTTWDGIPPPTMTGSNAMGSVNAFIAANGWNMHDGRLIFTWGVDRPKAIRGLPWEPIHDWEFAALTHSHILYVMLRGGHHSVHGVAYNPGTNSFAPDIAGFKPLKDHWYVWAQPDDPIRLPQIYEGGSNGEPVGPANGSQPIRSDTNSTSTAAGSRR